MYQQRLIKDSNEISKYTKTMKKILFIIGSLRKESFNKKLAEEVEQMIGERAIVEYLDYSDVPPMNQDIEFPAPEAVKRVRDRVAETNALWIFSPEYNYSYPGHLKNLFDCLLLLTNHILWHHRKYYIKYQILILRFHL